MMFRSGMSMSMGPNQCVLLDSMFTQQAIGPQPPRTMFTSGNIQWESAPGVGQQPIIKGNFTRTGFKSIP